MNVIVCLVWYGCLDFGGCMLKPKLDCDGNA